MITSKRVAPSGKVRAAIGATMVQSTLEELQHRLHNCRIASES
jgi:hypothetical protein